jgi:cysteine desulfurase
MLPWLGPPANPSSPHRAGQAASAALERAREAVAALVGREPAGVVFTSGATEANHLGVRGLAARGRPGVVVVSPIEHPSARSAAVLLEHEGRGLRVGAVDADGVVDVGTLGGEVAGVVLMAANHETGVVQPVRAVAAAARESGAWVHVDASQAAGRVLLGGIDADAIVLSAHKLGGPVGMGALVLRDGAPLPPLFPGVQERGRRGGTVNVAGAVGFAAACALARAELDVRVRRWVALRAHLEAGLMALGVRVVGATVERVATTTCAVLPGVPGDLAVQVLDLHGVCVSTGAACASGAAERSPTLRAMGDAGAGHAVRVSFGPTSTEAQVDALLAGLGQLLAARRA